MMKFGNELGEGLCCWPEAEFWPTTPASHAFVDGRVAALCAQTNIKQNERDGACAPLLGHLIKM
jgi:hypothetical protein